MKITEYIKSNITFLDGGMGTMLQNSAAANYSIPEEVSRPAYYLTTSHYSLNSSIYSCFLSGTKFGCYVSMSPSLIRCVKD